MNSQRTQPAELVPMQFRMPPEFVRRFKMAAAQQELKLNELLTEAFDCYIAFRVLSGPGQQVG